MQAGAYNSRIELQVMEDPENADSFVPFMSVWAYVNGLRGEEFWAALAGGVAESIVNVTVRYDPKIMDLAPQTTRFILDGLVFELVSPPDDVQFRHREIKFKARRTV